jgi:hypothetical protein|tara:strand:+ start:1378 stop:1563 length:186 start_codon:yes stop_codon:yes gene_type:complete
MTNLAVNGIVGFLLSGIVVLIVYFSYLWVGKIDLDYLLPIGSILIIIGLVTIAQLKMANRI